MHTDGLEGPTRTRDGRSPATNCAQTVSPAESTGVLQPAQPVVPLEAPTMVWRPVGRRLHLQRRPAEAGGASGDRGVPPRRDERRLQGGGGVGRGAAGW